MEEIIKYYPALSPDTEYSDWFEKMNFIGSNFEKYQNQTISAKNEYKHKMFCMDVSVLICFFKLQNAFISNLQKNDKFGDRNVWKIEKNDDKCGTNA